MDKTEDKTGDKTEDKMEDLTADITKDITEDRPKARTDGCEEVNAEDKIKNIATTHGLPTFSIGSQLFKHSKLARFGQSDNCRYNIVQDR